MGIRKKFRSKLQAIEEPYCELSYVFSANLYNSIEYCHQGRGPLTPLLGTQLVQGFISNTGPELQFVNKLNQGSCSVFSVKNYQRTKGKVGQENALITTGL